jgi:Na+-transporting NADH:ubiquinone oxidoreductase subunit NqrC
VKKQLLLIAALCSTSLVFGMNQESLEHITADFSALVERESVALQGNNVLSEDSLAKIKQGYVGVHLQLCALEAQNNIRHFQARSNNCDADTVAQIAQENRTIVEKIVWLQNTGMLSLFSEDEIEEFQEGTLAIYEQAWQEIAPQSLL